MPIRKALILVLIAELFCAVLALNNYGFALEALQATTRFSGRLSLVFFSVIFLLLPRDRNKLHTILSDKPFLIFAVAHGIHLIELGSYLYFSQATLIPLRLAGGFIAYLFIFAMPYLHEKRVKGKIEEKHYQIFENIYLYYVWFIFFMSYLPRVQGKLPNVGGTYIEFVVLLVWVCMLLGMKITSLLRHSLGSNRG